MCLRKVKKSGPFSFEFVFAFGRADDCEKNANEEIAEKAIKNETKNELKDDGRTKGNDEKSTRSAKKDEIRKEIDEIRREIDKIGEKNANKEMAEKA